MRISNNGVYAYIGIMHFIYLFIGLSSKSNLQNMVFFYLFLVDGAIISSYLIFGKDFVDNLKLSSISPLGLAMGVIIAEVMVFVELGFYGAFSYVIPYEPSEAVKGYLYMIFVAYVVGNSEEIFFRGFLPALAEKYHSDAQDLKISKYVIIPSLFAMAHYFAWANSLFNSVLISIYMFLYHFVFGVAMEFLKDYYGDNYTTTVAHTIYDATKMLMAA